MKPSLKHTHKVTQVLSPVNNRRLEPAEVESGLTMWFATYINSVEQKIEMEMWALKECGSHLPLDQS